MMDFPHHYRASATAAGDFVEVDSPGLPSLTTAGPAEFDGPGDVWSPETMITATIANCFILTFKAVARASKFDWVGIHCDVEATLDRIDRVTHFTAATINVHLTIEDESKRGQAERILHKSEENCLITNSMTTAVTLLPAIEVATAAQTATGS
ncbi:MAG TPA: OsmC family protein [Pseudomonadales bacterium]|nr:OsmC family protein [Pseudomonadales bacterium]